MNKRSECALHEPRKRHSVVVEGVVARTITESQFNWQYLTQTRLVGINVAVALGAPTFLFWKRQTSAVSCPCVYSWRGGDAPQTVKHARTYALTAFPIYIGTKCRTRLLVCLSSMIYSTTHISSVTVCSGESLVNFNQNVSAPLPRIHCQSLHCH